MKLVVATDAGTVLDSIEDLEEWDLQRTLACVDLCHEIGLMIKAGILRGDVPEDERPAWTARKESV